MTPTILVKKWRQSVMSKSDNQKWCSKVISKSVVQKWCSKVRAFVQLFPCPCFVPGCPHFVPDCPCFVQGFPCLVPSCPCFVPGCTPFVPLCSLSLTMVQVGANSKYSRSRENFDTPWRRKKRFLADGIFSWRPITSNVILVLRGWGKAEASTSSLLFSQCCCYTID